MGETTPQSLGTRIREVRTRAGMSQQQLGEQVRLERTAVNKIEAGTRKVSALELSSIARALHVRMAAFFEEPVAAVVAHRSSQGLDTVDSQIDALLADLADEVRLVHSLRSLTAAAPTQAWKRPDSEAEVEAMAAKARDLLNYDQAEPVREIQDRLATAGLFVFTRPLGDDTADAGTVLIDGLGVALVNSTRKVGRRRLAAAHELGHFLVKDTYTVDWRIADADEPMEARLDAFARAFLLPRKAVIERWTEMSERSGLRTAAVVIGSEYRVDMSTLARRLSDLGAVSASEAGSIRSVRTTQADMIELDLYSSEELAGTTQPRAFQRAVLELVREEEISKERAADLLWGLVDEGDLPAPRPREEAAFWEFVS
ncbi:XRE family transcriptional regulator [Actinomyces sp. MRS3W]|uniref:helix-turn-helix domain-containing protein n=1 Tax=Actinomyces sp. MRS3W TaxID=2800796 RepID=UPI0028FD6486|nr:XRE family transcriptional regulator [Actinomyces sp. MRS3W]MDU0347401.1 XRE family transcriptional regulator [Actinomyces sp. MRS3W]